MCITIFFNIVEISTHLCRSLHFHIHMVYERCPFPKGSDEWVTFKRRKAKELGALGAMLHPACHANFV